MSLCQANLHPESVRSFIVKHNASIDFEPAILFLSRYFFQLTAKGLFTTSVALVIFISATISWAIKTHLIHQEASADTPTCNINHLSQLSDQRGISVIDMCYTRRATHIQPRKHRCYSRQHFRCLQQHVCCDHSNKASTIARVSQAQRQPSAYTVATLNRKRLFQPSDISSQQRFNQHPRSTTNTSCNTQRSRELSSYRNAADTAKTTYGHSPYPKKNITKSYTSCCISPILTPLSATHNRHRQVNYFQKNN